ncbi:MAG: YggS family pyridoxal phosphate-dependent enzyme [Bacteroidetes bacterium]|nr:YggS family pyridoxal phosphate-dependent enzyme [Bacteroidota bacterium]
MVNVAAWQSLTAELQAKGVTLIAVSKTKPASDIQEMYALGQRDFGENYVQELVDKHAQLPQDIRWHYIGHLQSNKVKYIAPFVHLIHAVDSFNLLKEINKQAAKNNRTIKVLLQMHIADEETKFGMNNTELVEFLSYYESQQAELQHVQICGVMGMASFTDDEVKIKREFAQLKNIFDNLLHSAFLLKDSFNSISMGMSSDYKIAIEEGSTMVRIGSMLFGERQYNNPK